jgi:glycosyltransferase involved in cell wall biosynthesis
MRWLIDARPLVDPAQGGVSRVARGLISAFCELAQANEIILATTGQNQPPISYHKHIHLHIPNKLWSAATFTGLTALDQEIEKRAGKIDGVFLPNLGFVGKLNRPYVLLLHDLSFLIEPRWFSRKMRLWHRAIRPEKLIRGASALLAVSETTKRDAVKLLGVSENKITVIPIGPTIQNIRNSKFEVRTSPRYVLALGTDDPRKNSATAVQAVAALRQEPKFENLELLLVGADPCVGSGGHTDPPLPWVRLVYRPTDSELAELYQNAAAFLYPSWYEGYGLPLHEAAAYGTPCVASTAGALPETAPPGTLFADPAKPQHWVQALRIILSNVEYRMSNIECPILNSEIRNSKFACLPARQEIRQSQSWHPAAQILSQTLQATAYSGSSFCST